MTTLMRELKSLKWFPFSNLKNTFLNKVNGFRNFMKSKSLNFSANESKKVKGTQNSSHFIWKTIRLEITPLIKAFEWGIMIFSPEFWLVYIFLGTRWSGTWHSCIHRTPFEVAKKLNNSKSWIHSNFDAMSEWAYK